MIQSEQFTQLKNRKLWYDGQVEVPAALIPNLLLSGVALNQIICSEDSIWDDVKKFNAIEVDEIPNHKEDHPQFNFGWNIPSKYLNLDLETFIYEKFEKEFALQHKVLDRIEDYISRLNVELDFVNKNTSVLLLFKTIIFLIDEFKKNNVIWGVGRGSSCASLLLHVIGLHKVDPVKYGIPVEEFFHE